jgi:hypothetical protein
VVWIAAICVIITAIVVSVTLAMKSETGEKKNKAVVAPPPPPVFLDAAVAPIDAEPPKPQYEVVTVKIESTPPGAHIVGEDDGLDKGQTPFGMEMVLKDLQVHYVAQLPGYDDKHFSVNAATQKDVPVKFSMVKAVGRAPRTVNMTKPPDKQGSGSTVAPDKTNGELNGYHPELGSGTVHKP